MDNQGLTKPKSKEYVWFNENSTRKKILNKVLEGKNTKAIMKELGVKEHLVVNTINHPHFINRLNKKIHVMQTNLTINKIKIHAELLDFLNRSLNRSLPDDKRVQMTDAQIVNQLVNLTKTDANKIKIEKSPSFTFNLNSGKDRDRSEESKKEEENNLLKSFGITEEDVPEAQIKDE